MDDWYPFRGTGHGVGTRSESVAKVLKQEETRNLSSVVSEQEAASEQKATFFADLPSDRCNCSEEDGFETAIGTVDPDGS